MNHKRIGQTAVSIICVLLGMILAAQFKNVQKVGGSVSLQRTQELTSQLEKQRQDNSALQSQVEAMRAQLEQYEKGSVSDELTEAVRKELETARMEAGLLTVSGPGIILQLDHLYVTDSFGTRQVFQQVLDEDLLNIVNELNASGAEAICINDERLVATSEIRNAGKYVNINTRSYSVPFVIKAIGTPATLEAGLKLAGGVLDSLHTYYDISVTQQDQLTIPGYQGLPVFRYAVPVKDGK